MPIITISRLAGSYGDEFALRLANKQGYQLIDYDGMIEKFLKPIATEQEKQQLIVSAKSFLFEKEDHLNFKDYLDGALHEWANRENGILLISAGSFFLKDHPQAIHLRFIADDRDRYARLAEARKKFLLEKSKPANGNLFLENIDMTREIRVLNKYISLAKIRELPIEELANRIDRRYRRFVTTLFQGDESLPEQFYTVFNTSKCSVDACLAMTDALIRDHETRTLLRNQGDPEKTVFQLSEIPELKNQTEIDFAKMLNMYRIDWRYEPKFFPVEWDEDGRVTMAFSPDFYLPKFNLYLELTTMNQRYVTAKKKKLAKLKELYPGVNVRIVYRRDFLAMLERFEED